ncbi:MAG: patatin-like phospholipase family protein, partial [Streptosporangiaceae bacterium]
MWAYSPCSPARSLKPPPGCTRRRPRPRPAQLASYPAATARGFAAADEGEAGRVQTAFVLGGGGILGAHEVGMLRALSEAGIRPDLVVGTSVGAI